MQPLRRLAVAVSAMGYMVAAQGGFSSREA